MVTSAVCKYKLLDPVLLHLLCFLPSPPNVVHRLVYTQLDRAFASHFTLSTRAPHPPSRCRHGGRIWASPDLGIPLSSLDETSTNHLVQESGTEEDLFCPLLRGPHLSHQWLRWFNDEWLANCKLLGDLLQPPDRLSSWTVERHLLCWLHRCSSCRPIHP